MDDLFDPHKVYTIREFWDKLGVAPRTGEREMARGNSPVTTQLSLRRVGVLGADGNAYVRARRRVETARQMIDAKAQRP
jgi:hypothetical protein